MAEAALGAAQVVVMVVAVARPIVARGGRVMARDGGGQGSPRWWPPWANVAAPRGSPRGVRRLPGYPDRAHRGAWAIS